MEKSGIIEKDMITTDIFIRFLRCRLAGYLLSKREVGTMAFESESDINHFRKFCETTLLETETELKPDVKIHFQKEFEVEDLIIKPDAVINSDDGIILVKYKLSTFAMNDYDLWELAFNAYVLKAFDITVKEFRILSINREFKLTDKVNSNLLNGGVLEKAVRNKMFDIPKYIRMMRAAFVLDEEPKTRLGPKCEKGCPFLKRCYPYYKSALKISDMGYSNKISLPWNEINSREEIPTGTQFTSKQWHEVNAVFSSETQTNKSSISMFIEGVFKNKNVIYLHLMGIHSYFPTIIGAQPYEIALFQYDFIYSKKSQTPHLTNNINKKPMCSKSTLKFYAKFIEDISFDGSASIVVYEYERTVEILDSIKKHLPDYGKEINTLKSRLVNLSEVFQKRHYIDPALKGSSMLEDILPSLNSNLDWSLLNNSSLKSLRKDFFYLQSDNTRKKQIKHAGELIVSGQMGAVAFLRELISL